MTALSLRVVACAKRVGATRIGQPWSFSVPCYGRQWSARLASAEKATLLTIDLHSRSLCGTKTGLAELSRFLRSLGKK